MKKLFLCLVIASFIYVFASISYAAHYWAKTYGGNGDDRAYSLIQTSDGGYIMGGVTESFGAGEEDLWLMKVNGSGDAVWRKTYGGILNDASYDYQGFTMLETADASTIIVGNTRSFGAGDFDAWILKINSVGAIVWQKTYGGNGRDAINAIQKTTDGAYITAGTTSSFGMGYGDIWIMKLNSSGDVIWQKTYGGEGSDNAKSIQKTSDGGYIVVGSTTLSGDEWGDIYVLKLTRTGSIVWSKVYRNDCGDFGRFGQELQGEGYLIGGTRCNYDSYGYWLLKLDYSGNIIWQKTYGINQCWNDADALLQTPDGGYILAGSTEVYYGPPAVDHLALLVKIQSDGTVSWYKTYRFMDYVTAHSIVQTATGDYVLVGAAGTEASGTKDALLLKLDTTGNIPDCDNIGPYYIYYADTAVTPEDVSFTMQSSTPTITETSIVPQNFAAAISDICCYDNTSDFDGDGTGDLCDPDDDNDGVCDPGDSDIACTGSDNCPLTPNGPEAGTCIAGVTYKIARPCANNDDCGIGGFCSMNQEDTYPLGGDGIGDACYLCEPDFQCDGTVDGYDAATFKADFGRSAIFDPCMTESPCNGDFSCNGNVDGADAALFKQDFGRSSIFNPCPACVTGEWCGY
jgi:hypothetical protein